MRGWAVPDSNNFVQCVREGWSKKLESVDKEGCQIFGYLDVNRVAGNFHIAPGKTFTQHHVHVHDLQPFAASQFNLTHKIRHLSFGHSIPGKTNPLDGTVQAAHVEKSHAHPIDSAAVIVVFTGTWSGVLRTGVPKFINLFIFLYLLLSYPPPCPISKHPSEQRRFYQ
ncbi:Endoplasmic reticulum-Golgi intermediate compartment protein 3 [Araneus ventricosus]|uniref:Endoplasmic reticulum-Golgi intermediate compartment protein 3 n=1 Tax=Araneus ventricosus TaxID=182803 RepID=A0A4Y2S2D2_ARAVE|nr:Endoplasmic reticulum-Golgi intermediate compartment protein 3 [Araneus ventricosus]